MKQRFWKTRLNPRGSRNPGRRDGFLWNGNGFICPADIDGFRCDMQDPTAAAAPIDAADQQDSTEHQPTHVSRHEVAILDIARHAKLKGSVWLSHIYSRADWYEGVAKEFEMLETTSRTIALDEDVFLEGPQFMEDDASDWEDISDLDLDGGQPSQGPGADYSLVQLRNEEGRPSKWQHASGTRRKAYADVLRGAAEAPRL
ncbi:hypothetical protein FB451DRAFT_1374314 [Mycena latifolia]|nr:hypothetical protein FB451DRAFT_1374314 [Mycena latifolia]